jgi:hypothetical protein
MRIKSSLIFAIVLLIVPTVVVGPAFAEVTVPGPKNWFGTGENWKILHIEDWQTTWANYLHGNFSYWKFNTVRLAFSTENVGESQADLLEFGKLDIILDMFRNNGVKAILDCHGGVFNNDVWWTQWKTIVNKYKGDTRILGWELINEPPVGNITGNPVKTYNIATKEDVVSSLNNMTKWIRTIDNLHYIIYPAGFIPKAGDILKRQAISDKMVLDFHLWDYGNLNTTKQVDAQIAYRLRQVNSWNGYGYSYWCGEIGPHAYSAGGARARSLEMYFVKNLMNNLTSRNIAFACWLYSNNHWMTNLGVTYDKILSTTDYGKVVIGQ